MKRLIITTIVAMFVVCLSSMAFAETKDVTYTVPTVAAIGLGDPSGALTLVAPAAGTGTFADQTCTIVVSVSANNLTAAQKKVTLSTPALTGTTWSATTPATGMTNATGSAKTTITAGGITILNDIFQDAGAVTSTITLTAGMTAAVASAQAKTLTFTLLDE